MQDPVHYIIITPYYTIIVYTIIVYFINIILLLLLYISQLQQ